jgi:hypothetical protein
MRTSASCYWPSLCDVVQRRAASKSTVDVVLVKTVLISAQYVVRHRARSVNSRVEVDVID